MKSSFNFAIKARMGFMCFYEKLFYLIISLIKDGDKFILKTSDYFTDFYSSFNFSRQKRVLANVVCTSVYSLLSENGKKFLKKYVPDW